jgi:hypothetical protein
MSVLSDWIAVLTAQTHVDIDTFMHTPYGFDPLGVLCEMFRLSTYTLLTGQGTVSVSLLDGIASTRLTLTNALRAAAVPPPANAPELGDAISASFWATDTIIHTDKTRVRQWWDAIQNEQSQYSVAVLAAPGSTPVHNAWVAYQNAIALWTEWLGTLSAPGGWRLYLADWETADWVLDTTRTFYMMDGIATKLPESVQRWADLFEADPILTLTDSMAGQNVRMPLNFVVDGLVHTIDPTAPLSFGQHHRVYSYNEIVALLDTYVQAL